MKQYVPLNLKGILCPAIKLLKIMPAVGGVTIEEDAARRGVAKTRGAGKLLDLVILIALVELVNSHSLIIDGHINAVWDTL